MIDTTLNEIMANDGLNETSSTDAIVRQNLLRSVPISEKPPSPTAAGAENDPMQNNGGFKLNLRFPIEPTNTNDDANLLSKRPQLHGDDDDNTATNSSRNASKPAAGLDDGMLGGISAADTGVKNSKILFLRSAAEGHFQGSGQENGEKSANKEEQLSVDHQRRSLERKAWMKSKRAAELWMKIVNSARRTWSRREARTFSSISRPIWTSNATSWPAWTTTSVWQTTRTFRITSPCCTAATGIGKKWPANSTRTKWRRWSRAAFRWTAIVCWPSSSRKFKVATF